MRSIVIICPWRLRLDLISLHGRRRTHYQSILLCTYFIFVIVWVYKNSGSWMGLLQPPHRKASFPHIGKLCGHIYADFYIPIYNFYIHKYIYIYVYILPLPPRATVTTTLREPKTPSFSVSFSCWFSVYCNTTILTTNKTNIYLSLNFKKIL